MAEHGIVNLYQRIKRLQNTNGIGENAADKQSELFRCWGLIEWILQSEGNWILEEMEDKQLAMKVLEGLLQAKETLNEADIVPIRIPTDEKMDVEDLPEFPKYLGLPGPVVRQNILSFLGSADLLNVARAKPSEAQYFNLRLWHLQMEAVFSLLMNRDLLGLNDVRNLSQLGPFFEAFIIRHFESVEWKDKNYFKELIIHPSSAPPVEELPLDQENYSICHPVGIKLCRKMDSTTALLSDLGSRLLHLHFEEPEHEEVTADDVIQRMSSCLQLTPNLKTLSMCILVKDVVAASGQEILPELPSLKTLFVEGEPDLELPFLRKYGEQLEWLHIINDILGAPPPEYPVLSEDSSLSSLALVQWYKKAVLPPQNIFNNFASCPIKTLELCTSMLPLHQLLSIVGNYWGNTLESLELQTFHPIVGMPLHFLKPENPTWMLHLSFAKLKRLIILDYPLIMSWAFLLLFPALEELQWDYNHELGIMKTGDNGKNEPEPMIKLASNRSQMRGNNIWKLFSQLDKLNLGWDRLLTRSSCVSFQNRGPAEDQEMEVDVVT